MKKNYSLDLYKSLIEKNAFFTAALLTKSDAYNNADSLNFAWPQYDKSTFDSMLEFCPVLETEIIDPLRLIFCQVHKLFHGEYGLF